MSLDIRTTGNHSGDGDRNVYRKVAQIRNVIRQGHLYLKGYLPRLVNIPSKQSPVLLSVAPT